MLHTIRIRLFQYPLSGLTRRPSSDTFWRRLGISATLVKLEILTQLGRLWRTMFQKDGRRYVKNPLKRCSWT
jgi:hypothetical protein